MAARRLFRGRLLWPAFRLYPHRHLRMNLRHPVRHLHHWSLLRLARRQLHWNLRHSVHHQRYWSLPPLTRHLPNWNLRYPGHHLYLVAPEFHISPSLSLGGEHKTYPGSNQH